MFLRWGHVIAAHRRLVLILSTAALIVAIVAMALVGPVFQDNKFINDDREAPTVARQLADDFGQGDASIVFLFDADRSVNDPAVQASLTQALAPLTPDAGVIRVLDAANTGSPDFVSTTGTSTYAVVLLNNQGIDNATDLVDAVKAAGSDQGLTVSATGGPVVNDDVNVAVEKGLVRAEVISIPLTIIFLILIFGTFVAAGLPLITGAVGIVVTLAITFALSRFTDQTVFSINLITMLGLGLGVDYSLFMVSRFREEIAQRSVNDAVAVTVGTVGKAVFFSAITVIFGLAATQFFPIPTVAQMGQAGMLVVAIALVFGLTFLPALLAVLGTKVNRLAIRRRVGPPQNGFFHRLGSAVMARPWAFLLPILVVLLIFSAPLATLRLTPGDVNILGAGSPSRVTSERLDREFPANQSNTIDVVVTAPDGNALSAQSVAAQRDLGRQIAALPHVTAVEGLTTGAVTTALGYDWSTYAGDPTQLPAPMQQLLPTQIHDQYALLEVATNGSSTQAQDLVTKIRDLRVAGQTVRVGGAAALAVDLRQGIIDALPAALLFVFIGSYLILLLSFGSLVLPLKAIFMSLLSISSTLGIVIMVFQHGWLSGLLDFTANGELVATTPILMFCVLYGLSMDYEVLLLSRVQEEYLRTGDNRRSVAVGLANTGGLITGAAAIMIVVFGGFIVAEVTVIKSLGFGLALAVLIDATIVRCVLVPAVMRLLGRWNWWAPRPVQTLVSRLGFGHADLPASNPATD